MKNCSFLQKRFVRCPQATVMFASRSNNGNYKDNNWIFRFPNKACSNLRSTIPNYFKTIYNQDPKATTPCVIPAVSSTHIISIQK